MVVKVSFLVVASLAAYAVSQIHSSNSKRQESPLVNPSDGALMESEKVEEEEEEPAYSDIPNEDKKVAKMIISSKKLNNGTEKELLTDLTREYEQRKVTLEWKLLELYDLKEKKAYKAKLQRRLEQKTAEFDKLNATLASLQVEKMNLKEEIKQGFLVKEQLETAKKVIAEMQKKIGVNERGFRGQVMAIEARVFGFQEDETSERNALIEQKLKAVKDVEFEVVKMKRINKELELDKRELAVKLISAQAKITPGSHMTKSKILTKIEDEASTLRSSNEELSRQIEILQKDRLNMVEEIVYQRWLHSCLRFESQNNNNPPGETSSYNLSKIPCINSDEKIKPAISYPSSNSNISSNSSSTESDQVESFTIGSSSSSQNSSRKSFSLMQKFRNWGRRSKDDSSVASSAEKRRNSMKRTGLIRRFSTSMVAENSSMRSSKGESTLLNSPFKEKEEQTFTAASKKPSSRRVRRVSFSDLVKKDDMESSHGRELDQKPDDENSSYNFSTDFEEKENSEESLELSLVNGEDSSDTSLENASSKELSFDLLHVENKVENHVMSLFAAVLLFLLFIFLTYFLQYKR